MANQKAQLHNIQLATQHLNTTKYKTDISQYDGFLKNNSPFYGNVLSTFYTKTQEAPASDVFITSDQKIYYINKEDGCLYKDGQKILHSDNFIWKNDNDADLPTGTCPKMSDNFTLSYTSGSKNYALSKSYNVWTSEDNGLTYNIKEVSNTLPNSVVTANYCPVLKNNRNDFEAYGVPLDADGNYSGGLAYNFDLNQPGIPSFRYLYNNGQLQGFSVVLDQQSIGTLLCGLGTVDVDKPFSIQQDITEDTHTIKFFLFDGSFASITVGKDNTKARMTVANNRYIILNYAEYYNCYDTLLDQPFHFASDWNNRIINYNTAGAGSTQSSITGYVASCTSYVSTSSIGSNFSIVTNPFVSTQFAASLEYQLDTYKTAQYAQYCYSPDNVWIDFYRDKLRNSTYPLYVTSYNNINNQVQDTSLQDTRYTNSFYGVPSIFAEFTKSYLNKSIILDWNYSYTMTYVNGTKQVFAYSADDELEHVSAAFVIQGQDFVIINSIIYRYYSESGQLQACVNIDNMRFIGATPYQALFWSDTNKTFYTFTGDNLLNSLMQANEIIEFRDSGYNSNTMSVYAVSESHCYIFTQEQLIRIPGDFKKIYPLSSGMALFDGNNIIYYSYNQLSDYNKQPIELQTMYYGQGNNIVSVNDTVYIRLYDDQFDSTGKVELQVSTIKQGVKNTETKTFEITSDMWDTDSHTLFLRYQPRFQEATGFSVYVKSDFAISELMISEQPVTVQNSKYNI